MESENEIEPLIINRGPYFDKSATKNVTTLVGKAAYLNCRVRNVGNRTVSDRISLLIDFATCVGDTTRISIRKYLLQITIAGENIELRLESIFFASCDAHEVFLANYTYGKHARNHVIKRLLQLDPNYPSYRKYEILYPSDAGVKKKCLTVIIACNLRLNSGAGVFYMRKKHEQVSYFF